MTRFGIWFIWVAAVCKHLSQISALNCSGNLLLLCSVYLIAPDHHDQQIQETVVRITATCSHCEGFTQQDFRVMWLLLTCEIRKSYWELKTANRFTTTICRRHCPRVTLCPERQSCLILYVVNTTMDKTMDHFLTLTLTVIAFVINVNIPHVAPFFHCSDAICWKFLFLCFYHWFS